MVPAAPEERFEPLNSPLGDPERHTPPHQTHETQTATVKVAREMSALPPQAYAAPSRIGGRKANAVSHGKKIQVSCDTSVMKVSTSGRPIGFA
jgi:hypothetical protein